MRRAFLLSGGVHGHYFFKHEFGRLILPALPESFKETSEAETFTLSPIGLGEVAVPRGRKCRTWRWYGILPAEPFKTQRYIRTWTTPEQIISRLKYYLEHNRTINLTIPGTDVNAFVQTFAPKYTGIQIEYEITLCERRVVVISPATVPTIDGGGSETTGKTYYKVKITTPYAAGYARIYKSTSTESTVLKKLTNGTEVEYIDGASNAKWAKCAYNGITGWMWKANTTYSRKE